MTRKRRQVPEAGDQTPASTAFGDQTQSRWTSMLGEPYRKFVRDLIINIIGGLCVAAVIFLLTVAAKYIVDTLWLSVGVMVAHTAARPRSRDTDRGR